MSRPRKTGGILRTTMTKTPLREGSMRERTWDSRSDTSEGGVLTQHMRQLENSYKLSPDDERKFRPGKVETVMNDVLREFLTDVEYEKTLGQRMSKMLADTIKTRVKEFKWTRYKLVVHVIIGENREQDIVAGSRFLWYDETDTYASTQFSNKSLFALAVCFGVYYE
ncbi:dynein light chain Tctex-type protein 2B-like [Mya arenaria]|uniref:dynein light chain Tctex-type protein 2B-like n=1 Tax=Mya arenaria TaxID=6604 RepID=UPI0022E2CB63|nr:dynein light chain Tctex-type protein 2B-like [Mya arenaria]XP_052810678.1 dynein light chain Tctex-type protein 2B-like [Mya arenaria]